MVKSMKKIFLKFIDPICTIIDNISDIDEADVDNEQIITLPRFIIISAIHNLFNNNFNGDEIQPLSNEKFNRLPNIYFRNIPDYYKKNNCSLDISKSCCICQSNFDEEKELVLLPKCNHIFDRECIKIWLTEKHHVCPICRTDCN